MYTCILYYSDESIRRVLQTCIHVYYYITVMRVYVEYCRHVYMYIILQWWEYTQSITDMYTSILYYSDESIRRVLQTCIVMLISYISFFCWRANLDISSSALMREVVERFWIQPNIIWTLLIAAGYKLLYIR